MHGKLFPDSTEWKHIAFHPCNVPEPELYHRTGDINGTDSCNSELQGVMRRTFTQQKRPAQRIGVDASVLTSLAEENCLFTWQTRITINKKKVGLWS